MERIHTSVKKDFMLSPSILTLGFVVTAEGKSSYPLKTCLLLLKVTVILTLGLNESMTSPITLSTIKGSEALAIIYNNQQTPKKQRKERIKLHSHTHTYTHTQVIDY